jgi:hypothetical protein
MPGKAFSNAMTHKSPIVALKIIGFPGGLRELDRFVFFNRSISATIVTRSRDSARNQPRPAAPFPLDRPVGRHSSVAHAPDFTHFSSSVFDCQFCPFVIDIARVNFDDSDLRGPGQAEVVSQFFGFIRGDFDHFCVATAQIPFPAFQHGDNRAALGALVNFSFVSHGSPPVLMVVESRLSQMTR